MISNEALYSTDRERRYAASISEPAVLDRLWPLGCSGAANAYLALIGPSMGHHTGPKKPPRTEPGRPFVHPMRTGPEVIRFDGRYASSGRWKALCAAMLGGEKYVGGLTAVLNLDYRNAVDEKAIPQEALDRGLREHVWPLLTEMKPRLVRRSPSASGRRCSRSSSRAARKGRCSAPG